MRFVDTNVLLYAVSNDPREHRKTEIARDLLRQPDLGLSVQVLQEFYVQATRSGSPHRLTHREATTLIQTFRRYPVQELTVSIVLAALESRERYGISYWDAAIVEAARNLGCSRLLTEDLNHGQDYSGLRVENPFR